jgi:hypothetical protein
MPLTDTMLRNLKADGTPSKLADSEGLYLYLSPTGGKLWRMDYRFAGKRKTLSFGAYPTVSLKDTRNKRDNWYYKSTGMSALDLLRMMQKYDFIH